MIEMIDPDKDWRQKIKDEKNINEALLDHQGCAYDNCYKEIFGVITVPFNITQFNGISSFYYVNTPLCQEHYSQTPAVEYKWSKEDKEGIN